MTKKLTLSEWTYLKTEKCTNPQCLTAQLFSTQVRARYYQLVFINDKCCFDCNGYHTEHDKRRKMFEFVSPNKDLKELIEYSSEYLIDFSNFQNKKSTTNVIKNNENQPTQQLFQNTCKNLVEYLYHPVNYKTLSCPFISKSSLKDQAVPNNGYCKSLYCPFLHKDETMDSQLEKILKNLRVKMNKSEAFKRSDPNVDRKKFEDKLLNIMLLRSCKSIDDLYQKQFNMLTKQEESSFSTTNSSSDQVLKPNKNRFPAQDISEIQKIKQKLIQKASQYLKIDKQKQSEQLSRKVIDKNFSKDKQNKNVSKSKPLQQCQSDDIGVSYNYFKYGEKLSLIEGRTIQFKHFKDISEPNHIPLIMRYIAAFLNTQGGKMYIGIDDNSYAYGAKFKQSQYDKLLLRIDHEGKFFMTPPLMPQKYNIKLIPVYHDRKGEERWVIEIMVFPPKEQNKKLFLYNRECYMRMNASTHKLNASDIIELMSLNSENQSSVQVRQEDLMGQDEETRPSKFVNGNNSIQQKNPTQRQNQLMSQNSQIPNSNSKSRHKFQTQQSKVHDFETKLKSKSIQDLYILRKEFEEKLKIITQAYKKKERQTR